jgi:hypothetical protein
MIPVLCEELWLLPQQKTSEALRRLFFASASKNLAAKQKSYQALSYTARNPDWVVYPMGPRREAGINGEVIEAAFNPRERDGLDELHARVFGSLKNSRCQPGPPKRISLRGGQAICFQK